MSEWIKVIILGIVEGITEFLPISSTGHLIVTTALLGFENSLNGTFEIFIQIGAVVAVVLFYGRDIIQQMRSLPTSRETQQFWLSIFIAFVPAGITGYLFHGWIKQTLFTPAVVAASLIIGGIIFLLVERNRPLNGDTAPPNISISLRQALVIGLAQVTALIPGVSRSGASIVGGMQAGLSRRTATQFSFYLAIPTLGGATVYELLGVINDISNEQIALLLLGALVSGIVAWLAMGWLLHYVSRNTFVLFGYYRIAAGLVILLASAAGII